MAKVVWTERALDDLRSIDDDLAQRSQEAAARVVEGILDLADSLALQPRLGWREAGLPKREVRNLVYGHYRVLYQVVDDTDVRVLQVVHTRRGPDALDP
ncbi:MAG: type II toxin-antitoxin system RelE/ParE family toxin [Lacipirellulaceae bacterium]